MEQQKIRLGWHNFLSLLLAPQREGAGELTRGSLRSAFNFLFNCCSRLPLPPPPTHTYLHSLATHTQTPQLATHTHCTATCHTPLETLVACVSFSFLCFSFLLLLNHFVSFGPLSLFYFEFPTQNFVLAFYVNLYEIRCCYFHLPHDACCIREHVASCWKTLRVLRRQMRRNVGRGVGQKHTKPGTNTHTATQKGHTHRHMGHTLG